MTEAFLAPHASSTTRFIVSGGKEAELFFEPTSFGPAGEATLNAPLAATLLHWMKGPSDHVRVAGPVSATLLRNLDEMQHVWSSWRPSLYRRVELRCDEVIDDQPSQPSRQAISAFSGGVDATFTLLRHVAEPAGPHALPLTDVLMVHGFDIPLDRNHEFHEAVERSTPMLEDRSIGIRTMRTNLRAVVDTRWEDLFGLAVSAALLMFEGTHRWGLFGSSRPYSSIVYPWGSTPVQDWMASSGQMEIRSDGAGFTRTEKVAALADEDDMIAALRVCWQGDDLSKNCGRCEKCVRTMLNFVASGRPVPECFAVAPTPDEVSSTQVRSRALFAEYASILELAATNGVSDPALAAIPTMLRRSRLRNHPLLRRSLNLATNPLQTVTRLVPWR